MLAVIKNIFVTHNPHNYVPMYNRDYRRERRVYGGGCLPPCNYAHHDFEFLDT